MAFSKCNKLAKPPTCTLICLKLSKKRSYLILTLFVPAAKKVKPKAAPQPTRVSPPLRPKASPFTPEPLASA